MNFKRTVKIGLDSRIWKPSHLDLMCSQVYNRRRNANHGYADSDYLREVVGWLERAQDAAEDGGVSGRFLLKSGWTSSYPETTGYIVPTFLALAHHFGERRFRERAGRCIDFLMRLQLESGGFPGREVRFNVTQPSPFNTAQIIAGLTAWHKATGDGSVLVAARRAGDWLVSIQDRDGAFRQHTYLGVASTYTAHASCWLADLGQYLSHEPYLSAASRHLDWVLSHQDARTGWFDKAGFTEKDHAARTALTHTIAYTIWGVLASSLALGRDDGIEAARRAAERVARRLELSGSLPAKLDHQWCGRSDFSCLTGNAPMALIWFRLYELGDDVRFVNTALKAIDSVKLAQRMNSPNPGIRGGIPGSDPVWGKYIPLGLPNWAAKFFIDALLAKKSAFARLRLRRHQCGSIRDDVPQHLPRRAENGPEGRVRVIFYTSTLSQKVPTMLSAWSEWGFQPTHVIVETSTKSRVIERIVRRVRDDGVAQSILRSRSARSRGRLGKSRDSTSLSEFDNLTEVCASRQIPIIEVDSLQSPEGLMVVAALQPDLAIHADVGLLRAPVLAIPRLGTLNAHMGVLPTYRGMHVAEWASLLGGPTGCSVHLIDPGIDTGAILCVAVIEAEGATSIGELRSLLGRHQIVLLGEVVRYVIETGELPPRRSQAAEEGRQYFRMHPGIASVLEAELRSKQRAEV